MAKDSEENEDLDEELSIDLGSLKKKLSGMFSSDDEKSKSKLKEAEDKIEKEIDEDKADIKKLQAEEKKVKEAEKKVEEIEEKKEKVRETEEEIEKEEEEISLDIGKIKNFFKRREKTDDEDESVFDWQNTMVFFKKYGPVILILIAFLFSVHIRMMPASLPLTDEWATNSVNNFFRNQVKSQIDSQYPNLPDQNKDRLIEQELQKVMKEQKDLVKGQIEATSNEFKAMLQKDGQTYLLAIDPYFWMRHANNIVENGHPGDSMKDGKPWDDAMYAPIGREVPKTDRFHAYLEAYTFMFVRWFKPDVDIMAVVFYVPVILASLAVIPAFFITRKLGGNLGGFIAALIVGIHPSFVSRTAGGFADTDPYNILFPLLVTWMLFIALETNNMTKASIFTAIGGLIIGIYSAAWGGWWYIMIFMIVLILVYIAYFMLTHVKELKTGFGSFVRKPAIKNTIIILLVFLISSLCFVTLFRDFATFEKAFTQPIDFMRIKEVGVTKVWPNVYTTVAEQNVISIEGIVSNIGGKFLFIISIIGIILSLLKRQYGSVDIKYAVLLGIWTFSTMYASTKGVRWILLMVPAFAIAIGICAGMVYKYVPIWTRKSFDIKEWMMKIIILLLVLFLIGITPIPPFCSHGMCQRAVFTGEHEIPSMNDAWFNSLDKINKESAPDAIINSWWDFGHWFKAIGNRSVTFDGTSQNTPMAHWIGNVLLTDDENKAIGILRMLDCGSYTGFDELDKVIKKPYKSVEILYEIIVMEKEGAMEKLAEYGLNDDEINNVIERTHCSPPENYFIASEDMVGKSGVWAHFGSWDFRRATIFNQLQKMDRTEGVEYLINEFGYSSDEADSLYFEVRSLDPEKDANTWIAPWPSYASGMSNCNLDMTNMIANCDNGFMVELKTMDVYANTNQGKRYPRVFAWADEEGFHKKEYFNDIVSPNGRDLGAALIPSRDSFKMLLMDPKLAAAMYTRMFYFAGHGLSHFDSFSYERSSFGNKIYTYKVDWEGGDQIVMPDVSARKKAFEGIVVRHILVNSSSLAEDIIGMLKRGEEFGELAEKHSLDPGSNQNGGMLGYIKRGKLVPEFEQVAFELEIGEVSDPVQTQFGYHVIQVTEKRNEFLDNLARVRGEVEEEVEIEENESAVIENESMGEAEVAAA